MQEQVTQRIEERLRTYLGDQALALISDHATCELSANSDGGLFVSVQGEPDPIKVGEISPELRELFICAVAARLGKVIDDDAPAVSGELPDYAPWRNARFQGMLPPAVKSPLWRMRMHNPQILKLESYVESGIMTEDHMNAILNIVATRGNFLIPGPTFSGKTTLFNAILAEVAGQFPDDHVVVLEDTREVQMSSKNVTALHTTAGLELRTLFRHCKRLSPRKVYVGEVRGAEAQSFLEELGSGVEGGCTIHAGSALGGLKKLEDYCRDAGHTPDRARIAQSINLIVVIKEDKTHPKGRRVTECVLVKPELSPDGEYQLVGA